jgi:hypothetical protein
MIEMIRLHHVLREAVATPYHNLVTRHTGAAVRVRIEAAVARSGCGTALLDFTDVELLDFSCADEIVAKLLLAAHEGLGGGVGLHVVLSGLNDHQREAIEDVLTHQGLAVLVHQPAAGDSAVLGRVPDDALAALRALAELGPCTAAELAVELSWDVAHAQWALDTLAAQRLVRREPDGFHPLRVA